MRTFIALELPPAVKRHLAQRQQVIQQQSVEQRIVESIRWTAPDRLHMTLRFLGETTENQRDQIVESLPALARQTQPFSLSIGGLGCFPNFRRPNIVWVDVQGDVDALKQLQRRVETAVQAAGFAPEERPFAPHLTIGRAERNASGSALYRSGELLRQVGQAGAAKSATASLAFVVNEVVFMHSDLQPQGPRYTALGVYSLLGS